MEEMLFFFFFSSKYCSYALFQDSTTYVLSPNDVLCGSLKKRLEQYQRSTETFPHIWSAQGAPPSAGRKNFHLKMREMRILCEGQFIIIWTPAGCQDWTLNKLRQDICSKLASLTALHKQESAGVRHVERLPNRVINLCKQKNLPNKHISSHRTPG